MWHLVFLAVILNFFSNVSSQSCSDLDLPRGCLCFNLDQDGVKISCAGMKSTSQVLDVIKSAESCLEFILTGADLISFPLGIGKHRLQFLSIVDSRIAYLSPPNSPESAFEGLNDLQSIKLENLEDISDWDWTKLRNLPSLKTIFIDGGRLANVPKSFSSAGNLNVENVILSHCQIQNIQNGGLAFPNAKFIQIDDNQLHELRAEMFHPESNIERLLIYDVPITSLPEDVFKGMKKLKSFFTDKEFYFYMTEKHLQHVQLNEVGIYTGKDKRKSRCDCKYSWFLRHTAKFLYECTTEDGIEHDFQEFLESC